MNLAREDACRRMRFHGYRVTTQGVAMQRPHAAGLAATLAGTTPINTWTWRARLPRLSGNWMCIRSTITVAATAVWLAATKPTVGIISAGTGNTYGHPTLDCLERLHNAGTHTYWTEEGQGAEPVPGWDMVSGNIIVQVDLGGNQYTVAHGNLTDTYAISGGTLSGGTGSGGSNAKYAWSSKSKTYHYSTCTYVSNISAENLQTGSTPPAGKTLHEGCPITHQ